MEAEANRKSTVAAASLLCGSSAEFLSPSVNQAMKWNNIMPLEFAKKKKDESLWNSQCFCRSRDCLFIFMSRRRIKPPPRRRTRHRRTVSKERQRRNKMAMKRKKVWTTSPRKERRRRGRRKPKPWPTRGAQKSWHKWPACKGHSSQVGV